MTSRSIGKPPPRAAARDASDSAAILGSKLAVLAATEDGGLWVRSNPEAIAKAARELFGTDAAQAIEWCALSASNAHRKADLRFWRAVRALLASPAPDEKP